MGVVAIAGVLLCGRVGGWREELVVNSGKLICKSEVWPAGAPHCQLEALGCAVKRVEEGPR